MVEAYRYQEYNLPPKEFWIKDDDAWNKLPKDVQESMRRFYGTPQILNEVGRCVALLTEEKKEEIVKLACESLGVEIEFVSFKDESSTDPADPSARS